jgi:hypothetical protein
VDVQHPASTSTSCNRETDQQPHTTILPKWIPGTNSFIVCHGVDSAELHIRLTCCLSFLGYEFTTLLQDGTIVVLSTKNATYDEIYYIDGHNFVIASGMFFFNGAQGKAALQHFFDTFNERNPNISGTRGNFCLLPSQMRPRQLRSISRDATSTSGAVPHLRTGRFSQVLKRLI